MPHQTLVGHAPIDPSSARPAPFRGPFTELFRWLSLAYLKVSGWRLAGDWPAAEKVVVIAAPHTSNWDGINMLAAAGGYRARLSWMGKKSLTTGPFGGLVKWAGCVPVDRTSPQNMVQDMTEAFASRDRLNLAVPPEGTRSEVSQWKSGFYRIAQAANVPLLVTVLDYKSKTMRLAALVTPQGDYDAELPAIMAYYNGSGGKFPELSPWIGTL